MEPQRKGSAKDFFINLGATVALYTTVISLVNLLFRIINSMYPPVTSGYYYSGSTSISFPVAVLIIAFPVLVYLMWLVEKQYMGGVEKSGVHKWLSYITIFVASLIFAGDLITVIYKFIDGQELTVGFLLKIAVLLVVSGGVFMYYLSDIKNTLTSGKRKIWRVAVLLIVLGSIVWGFSVLGSPRTQRLYKYDDQKLNDLMSLEGAVGNFYYTKNVLPKNMEELKKFNDYIVDVDSQSKKPYEYTVTGKLTYDLCAEFNKSSKEFTALDAYSKPYGYSTWQHDAGRFCFHKTLNPSTYGKVPAI